MKRLSRMAAAAVTILALPGVAAAHISIVSGAGTANTSQRVTFGVGHGCAGADTVKVRIEIPASVVSVRPETSDFGRLSVETDATGAVAAVSWQKADADVFEADVAYYQLTIRVKVPNQPFTTIFFPAHQTCRAADGAVSTAEWVGLPTDPIVDGGTDEPAPALSIVPARFPGWNKLIVAQAIPDLGVFFADALIVWKGSAAYSANPATRELIAATSGVTSLATLAAGDELWVRY